MLGVSPRDVPTTGRPDPMHTLPPRNHGPTHVHRYEREPRSHGFWGNLAFVV